MLLVLFLAVSLLAGGSAAAQSSSLRAAKPGCNGLVAFSSNRSQDALAEIYRIGLDGTRNDVSRSIGVDSGPVPSPDGSKVAFWSGVNGLVVSDADGQNQRPLVAPGGTVNSEGEIAWAPDSRRLAITGGAVSRVSSPSLVLVYDTQTGAGSALGVGSDPHFSPDGTLLEYQDHGANGFQAVFVVSADGTGRKEIAAGVFVAWSPDGTRILGVSGGDSWVAPVGGGATVAIPAFGAQAWTPDGRRIIGAAGETVAADGSELRVIARNALFDRPSPDGRQLALLTHSSSGPGFHVLITDLDGNALRDLGSWAGQPPETDSWPFGWSPDSIHLALWSGGKVIVADTSTGATQTLAGGTAETTAQPVWSADGNAIYDSITDATGNTDLYLANPDGTDVRRIVKDAVPDVYPSWSPNGEQIAFVRYGSPATLAVTDTAGHTRTLLRDPGLGKPGQTALLQIEQTGLGPPAWSPDGETIAVASTFGLTLVDVRRGLAHRFGPVIVAYPAFSPDGTRIAYATSNLNGGESLVVARLRAGGPPGWSISAGEVYGDQDQEPGLIVNTAWSPDGRRISFTRFGVGEYGPFGFQRRTYDTRTHRLVGKYPDNLHAAISPDGRFVVDAGFDTTISRIRGKVVTSLNGLRAADVSWQSLCTPGRSTP